MTVYRTFDELQRLAPDWNELLQRSHCDTVFLTWEWIARWTDVYGVGNRLLVVALYDDNRLAALAPLWIKDVRVFGFPVQRVLRFLGANEVCADYLDFIVQQKSNTRLIEAIWQQLFGPLKSAWDIFEYHHVPDDSPVFRAFRQYAEDDNRCLEDELKDFSYCPYIELPDRWDDYVADLSVNNRRALRVAHRRLTDRGELHLEFCRAEDDLPATMQRLIELNRRIWQARGEPGSFSTPEFERFHLEVAREFLARDRLFLCSLWLEQQYLGSFYGFLYHDTLYFYIMSAERELFPRTNIGRVLLGMCVERAIELGCREFDMLRGDEEYKTHWTERTRCNVLLTLYRRSLRSLFALVIRHLRRSVKYVLKAALGTRWTGVRRALARR